MDLKFEVSARISRPVEDVFEAVADPEKLSSYFTTGGAKSRPETGATVIWDFHDYPGAFPVEIIEVEPNRHIILKWEAFEPDDQADTGSAASETAPYMTTATLRFEPLELNTRTLVTISEQGWRQTPGGLKASYRSCMGWSQMLCAMKAYVEYGINLREGMYK